MGRLIRERLSRDFAQKAEITASSVREAGRKRNYKTKNLTDRRTTTYWATPDGERSATLTLAWRKPITARYVELMEPIALGQRVKKFRIETTTDGTTWTPAATAVKTTTIGYKRIVPLNGSTADGYANPATILGLRVIIEDAKSCPLISKLAVY